MLTRVHFAGIRSLLDVSVDLERFTVLVGPNGCGKSTLLNQIELLCSASAPPPTDSGFVLGWWGRRLQEAGPSLTKTAGAQTAMVWEGTDGPGGTFRMEVPHHVSGAWYQHATGTLEEGKLAVTLTAASPDETRGKFEAVLLADFNWRAQRLRLSPDAVSQASPANLQTLDPSGFGLPTILKDLAADDPDAYRSIQEDLGRIVPNFRSLKFGKVSADGVDHHTLLLEMNGGGRLPASNVSDGTLLALALLAVTHNREMPSIVLMDDIDHGLHLGAQFEMIKAIRAVMDVRKDLQVICTTHSPVLLDSFAVSEVRVMAQDTQGHTKVKPLKDHPKLDAWRAGFTPGELWANLGEEWVVNG